MVGDQDQRTALRDHTHVTGRHNRARNDANFGLTRRNQTRAVWPQQTRVLGIKVVACRNHVQHGNVLRQANDQLNAGVGRFINSVYRKASWYENHGRIGTRGFNRLLDAIEDWHFGLVRFKPLAALARRHARHHIGAVGDHLLGVERAFSAGNTLYNESCVFVYEDTHAYPSLACLAAATAF